MPLPEVQAEVCCHGQYPNGSLKCLSCLFRPRGCLGIHALVVVGYHMPGHKAVAILVECFPQCLRNWGGSSTARIHSWWRSRILLSLGQYYFQSYSSAESCYCGKSSLQRGRAVPRDTAIRVGGMEKVCLLWKAQGGLSSLQRCWLKCRAECCSPRALPAQMNWTTSASKHHTDTVRGQRGQDPLWESPPFEKICIMHSYGNWEELQLGLGKWRWGKKGNIPAS